MSDSYSSRELSKSKRMEQGNLGSSILICEGFLANSNLAMFNYRQVTFICVAVPKAPDCGS